MRSIRPDNSTRRSLGIRKKGGDKSPQEIKHTNQKEKKDMASIDSIIQKCVDKINMSEDGENVDIYKYMMRYKAIREMPYEEQDRVYDEIANVLGYN